MQVTHDDDVASYGDWTTGERHTWHAANDNTPRRDPVADAARRAAQERARADAATAAAGTAARVWESGKPATDHPYLTRKGIACDGLRVDEDGNLWSSAGDGVHCISPEGKLLGKILVPHVVSNLCFGGLHKNRLFIGGSHTLYSIFLNRRGAQWP